MCIGLPMQVLALSPGHALCQGRGEMRQVRTALVGPTAPGDWLLVFLDSARDILSARRAQEINETLDLLDAALQGTRAPAPAGGGTDAFELPSRMSREQLLALSGGAR